MKTACVLAAWLLGFGMAKAGDADSARFEQLLAAEQAPDGVVFEIMAWRDHSWDWAAPRLRDYVERLRARYPRMEFALVSHGAELFELAREAEGAERPSIRTLARLSREGMPVHVDGAYASWKRLGQQDFLDFVDIVPSAETQLADYVNLGYLRIKLEPPHATD